MVSELCGPGGPQQETGGQMFALSACGYPLFKDDVKPPRCT